RTALASGHDQLRLLRVAVSRPRRPEIDDGICGDHAGDDDNADEVALPPRRDPHHRALSVRSARSTSSVLAIRGSSAGMSMTSRESRMSLPAQMRSRSGADDPASTSAGATSNTQLPRWAIPGEISSPSVSRENRSDAAYVLGPATRSARGNSVERMASSVVSMTTQLPAACTEFTRGAIRTEVTVALIARPCTASPARPRTSNGPY